MLGSCPSTTTHLLGNLEQEVAGTTLRHAPFVDNGGLVSKGCCPSLLFSSILQESTAVVIPPVGLQDASAPLTYVPASTASLLRSLSWVSQPIDGTFLPQSPSALMACPTMDLSLYLASVVGEPSPMGVLSFSKQVGNFLRAENMSFVFP